MNNLKDYSYLCRLRIEYMHGINIKENYLLGLENSILDKLLLENSILDKLLLDRTTGENIIWATDDHAVFGDSYTFFKHITPESVNFAEYCLGYCVQS